MSLTLHNNRKNWGLPDAAGYADRESTASPLPAIFQFISKAALKSATFLVHVHEVFAEARMHKAMVEVELYRNRYRHASKNDDDLPIAVSASAERPAPSVSPRVALRCAGGAVASVAKRAYPVVFLLAIFAVATTIAIRLAI